MPAAFRRETPKHIQTKHNSHQVSKPQSLTQAPTLNPQHNKTANMPSNPTVTREQFLEGLAPWPVSLGAKIDIDIACIICMSEPVDVLAGVDDEHAVVLHDTHVFGERCIRQWLPENNTCPIYRAVLFEEDEVESDSDFEDEMFDDMEEFEDTEAEMTPAEFAGMVAEEEYDIAAATGLLDFAPQLNRFRRDFRWLRDMDLKRTGGERSDAGLMELWAEGTAFSDFDPDNLPLAVIEDLVAGTLPDDFDSEMMPVNAIEAFTSGALAY